LTQVESYSPRRARRAAGPTLPPESAPRRGRQPDRYEPEPEPDSYEFQDEERRGSHATAYGQGFSWVLGWTIAGAFIPGTGLVAAGWRRLGGFLLFLLGLGALALVALVLLGDPLSQGVSLAVDPQKLLLVAVVAAGGAGIWILLVLLTNTQLRRFASLSSGQSAFSWLVVSALVVGIALPAYKVSSYAMITRGVLTSKSIFRGDADNPNGGPNAKQADPWAGKARENVLLIGSDAGSDRIGVRPDTMILASIDTKTGNTVLFSLPRNLQRAPFAPGTPGARAWPDGFYCPNAPKGQECLLNAIWTWASAGDGLADYKSSANPGLQATRDAVQGVTGLKVDTYVMLNLKGFQNFIDNIGGLTVNVTERLPIGGDVEHPVPTHGYIEKGKRKLDGFNTLWYARSRWSTNDYDRMQRQRCVIGDVVSQADPVTLAKVFPKIAQTLRKNLSTGIATSDLQAWVELSQRVKGAKVTSLPFTNQVINTVNPDYEQVHSLVAKALKASNAKPAATPTPSPGASTSTVKKKAPKIDASKAQDVKAVC
jgi:LCP family protein required for cell wall assembly